jgi:hypothetical protein
MRRQAEAAAGGAPNEGGTARDRAPAREDVFEAGAARLQDVAAIVLRPTGCARVVCGVRFHR